MANALSGIGSAFLRGFPETDIKRRTAEADIEYRKAMTGYYNQRGEQGGPGGRASIDRLLTIIRNLGSDATPEFLDTSLNFILENDPQLRSLYEKMHGTEILESKTGTMEQTEKMRIFRNSLLEPDGSVLPENQQLFNDVTNAYKKMLNNLSKRYGEQPRAKGALGSIVPDNLPGLNQPATVEGPPEGYKEKTGFFGNVLNAFSKSSPTTTAPKQMERPFKSDMFDEIDTMAQEGALGAMSKSYLTANPDTPKSGDPKEIEAYKNLVEVWGRLDRSIAEKILALRAAGVPYDKIMGADELLPFRKK